MRFSPCLVASILALIIVPFGQAQEKMDPAATREYAVAVGLQSKKLYPQAAQRWQKFIAGFPKDPRLANAWHQLGVCFVQEKKFAEAAKTLRIALEKFPKFEANDATQHNLGLALYNLGLTSGKVEDLREAAKAFAEVPGKFPKSKYVPTALYYEAECFYLAGDAKEAIGAYRRVIEGFPDHALLPDVYYALGTAQQEVGKEMEAAATFQEFLKKYAKHELANECRLRLAQSQFKAKNYVEAEPHFRETAAIKEFELADFALLQQGQCLYELDQFEKAAAVFERLPGLFPKSVYRESAQLALGKAWHQAKKLDKARAAFFAVLEKKGTQAPAAAYWLGQTLLNQGKATEAAAILEKAIAQYPKTDAMPQLLYTRVRAIYEQPDGPKKAASLFAEFAGKHPEHKLAASSLYMAALAYFKAGDLGAAQMHAEQFLANGKFAKNELLPEVLFIAGECHLQILKPDPGKAQSHFRRLLTEFPKHDQAATARLRIGLCLRMAKRNDEAIAFLKEALPLFKDPAQVAQALYQLGEFAFDGKLFDQSAQSYDELAKRFPKHELAGPALYGMGLAHLAQKEEKKAAEAFSRLLKIYPGSANVSQARYLRGLAFQRLKQFESAVSDLKAYLSGKTVPREVAEARYALALCQVGLNRHEEAAATLTELLKNSPDYPDADKVYYELAFALLKGKKEKEAAEAFHALAVKHPESVLAPESWFRLAEIHAANKQLDEAAREYAAGLEKAKASDLRERLQYKLGWAHYQRKQWVDAAKAFGAFLKEHPKGELRPYALNLAGECHFKQRDFKEALPLFEQLARLKDKTHEPHALYRSAACLAGLKKWSESQKLNAELIDRFPSFELLPEARYGMGWALQNQGKLDEARAVYEQVASAKDANVSGSETAAKCRFMVGECAFGQKKFKEAIEHFFTTALGYSYPEWQGLAYFEAGRCFIELKNTRQAIETLEALVSKFPSHPRARDAATLIKQLKSGK